MTLTTKMRPYPSWMCQPGRRTTAARCAWLTAAPFFPAVSAQFSQLNHTLSMALPVATVLHAATVPQRSQDCVLPSGVQDGRGVVVLRLPHSKQSGGASGSSKDGTIATQTGAVVPAVGAVGTCAACLAENAAGGADAESRL